MKEIQSLTSWVPQKKVSLDRIPSLQEVRSSHLETVHALRADLEKGLALMGEIQHRLEAHYQDTLSK